MRTVSALTIVCSNCCDRQLLPVDRPPVDRLDVLLLDQSLRVRSGTPRPVEVYLTSCPDIAADPELKFELVYNELRSSAGPGCTLPG